MAQPRHTILHPWWWAGIAAVMLAVSWAIAVRDLVPSWELDLTRWINDVPDVVAWALWPLMQLGTVWAPVVVGLVILIWRRDVVHGVAIMLVGVASWFIAKWVKSVVDRGRPLQYLPSIDVREGAGTGLGFISGHSCVAAATMVMVMPVLPPRWRPLAVVVALLVGLARIVFGVHLPVDVIGGWSVGVLLGLAALAVVDRIAPPVPAGEVVE
jgi:membrane-associated phospholipid phosphatase